MLLYYFQYQRSIDSSDYCIEMKENEVAVHVVLKYCFADELNETSQIISDRLSLSIFRMNLNTTTNEKRKITLEEEKK